MSGYLEQANATWDSLKTKIDVTCLNFKQPNGKPLEFVYLHPITAGMYAKMDKDLASDHQGERELAVFDFLLRAAVNERGHRVFNDEEVEQLPHRVPLRQLRGLWADVIHAMRKQSEEFIEKESENFDAAASPSAVIESLRS